MEAFKAILGELDAKCAFPLEFFTTGSDGRFSLSPPAAPSHPGYQIQIEKAAYPPAVFANLLKKDGNQTLEFKLQKGSVPAGVVLLAGGGPAANAIVWLCTRRAGVTLDGPAHVQRGLNRRTYRAQTDAAGRFSLSRLKV